MKSRIRKSDTLTLPVVLLATAATELHKRWRRALEGRFTLHEVAERHELERRLAHLKPDLLLLDLALPQLGGPEGVRELQCLSPLTRIVLFTRAPQAKEAISVLRVGARGYCNRNIGPALLKKAVVMVHKGQIWVRRNLIPHLIEELTALTTLSQKRPGAKPEQRFATLTPRERDIVLLVGACASNKEIATRLNVTEKTVKAHLTAIFRKLELSGRVQLALFVNEHYRDLSLAEASRSLRPKPN